jgi:predicted RecA/RadA family phage recombinase
MAQVPATAYAEGCSIDYTPGSAVTAGDVVVQNGLVGIATVDIAASALGSLAVEGLFKVPKTTAAWTAGLPVYWNATGSPDNGDASSGAANQLGLGTLMGVAAIAAASGDDYGVVNLNESATGLIGVQTVAAAGSTQSDAAALGTGLNIVTGADGTKGVVLPTAKAGMIVYLKGTTAGVLKVYPATGGTINALSANAAMSLASGAVPAILVASSATQWYTFPLLPS